jgi:hypothetical protein
MLLDTTRRGNGDQGHDRRQFGAALYDHEKRALVEYQKTF